MTPRQRFAGNSGFSRLQIVLATKRSVEFFVIKFLAPWRSLTSAHPPPAPIAACRLTLTTPRIRLTSGGKPQSTAYVRIACPLFRKMMFRVMHIPKTLQPWVPFEVQSRTSPQSNARHVPKNGRARRRPVEPPESNTPQFALISFV